jgi:hypothetical protein
MKIAFAILTVAVLLKAGPASAEDWSRKLLEDAVQIKGGKMTSTDYGLLTLPLRKGKRLQIKWYAEAPASGVVSRDNFVGVISNIQTLLLFGLASGGKKVELKDLKELYVYEELDDLIGRPDVTISVFVAKNGLQIEVAADKVSRQTITWDEVFAKPSQATNDEGSGAPTCDRCLTKMQACISELPRDAKKPARDALRQTQEGWKVIYDKRVLEDSCRTAYDLGKQAMGAMCPKVRWD